MELADGADECMFSVSDNGAGISEEDYVKIFERFYQAENIGQYGGTGIGLALSQGIVKAHQGDITVESQLGKGSCFKVTLKKGDAHFDSSVSRIEPEQDKEYIYYSEDMSHKVYAACDAFLMPSLFEPCGLSQLMALRYGTVPIVRETGGLKDTVWPYNEYDGTGTGFSFANYNAHEMLATVRYAEQIYYDKKRDWNKIVERAMNKDFSWKNSAKQYEELYEGM